MQLGIHEATHLGHRDANANSGQALAVSAMTPRVRKRDWPEDRAGGRPCVGVDPARSKAGEHGRINTRKRQGVIASGSIATRFSSLVEHDPSGQARGISMLFPKPVLTSGSNALLQRRAARSREWVDRSPVGGVSGDLVVLEGLQHA